MATRKKPGSAMVRWDEELAKEAEAQAASEKGASLGSFFSIKGGQLSFQSNPIKGNTMDVIILDYVLENLSFVGDYDPDDPRSPECYAFGRDEEDMAPHENSTTKFSNACKGCPRNEFGSAEKGRGKACKNTRRIAMIPYNALDNSIEDAEIAYMKLPVTSVKGWAGYVDKLKNVVKRPTWAVITTVEVIPDAKNQVAVTFSLSDKIDNEHLPALKARAKEVAATIEFPYPKNADRPAPSRGRSAASKAATSKAAAPKKKAKF